MKINILPIVLMATLTGCVSQLSSNSVGDLNKLTISCSQEQYLSDETKSVFVEDTQKILWEEGDVISLFQGDGNSGGYVFESSLTEPSAISNFVGLIPAVTGGGEVSSDQIRFYGIFPFSEENKIDGDVFTTRIKSVQYAREYSFEHDSNPTVAVSNNLEMGFYNVCGGIRFTVSNPGINSIVLKGNNNENIAGLVNVRFNGTAPEIVSFESGETEIKVIAPQGGFVPEVPYYILMAPTLFANGFSVTFNKGTMQGTRVITSNVQIQRRIYSKLTKSDKDFEYNEYTGIISFNDPAFKEFCVSYYDCDGNGEIDVAEAGDVTSMDFRPEDWGIVDMSGIEFFKNLEYLSCCGGEGHSGNRDGSGTLARLDISNNTKLKYLDCSSNALVFHTLDLREFSSLEHLMAGNTYIDEILFSGNPIKYLHVGASTLTDIDVRTLTDVERIEIGETGISSLDVSNCHGLKHLLCYDTPISNLDLSKNTMLEGLDCGRCDISSLDLSSNTALKVLKCDSNHLTSLDVANNTELYHLQIGGNQIESIDISSLNKLETVEAGCNKLLSLDLSQTPLLSFLDCSSNMMDALDVSGCPDLEQLYCSSNRISTLDISQCLKLSTVDLSSMNIDGNNVLETVYVDKYQNIDGITVNRNRDHVPEETQIIVKGNISFIDSAFESYCLSEFDGNHDGLISYAEIDSIVELDINTDLYQIEDMADIRHFNNLEMLRCVGNGSSILRRLDVSLNNKLRSLDVHGNILESLALGRNDSLTFLDVSNNDLTEIDLSGCQKLGHLDCSANRLVSLSLYSNPSLSWLDCSGNEITSLNLANNTSLATLKCAANAISSLDVSRIYSLSCLDISGNNISSIDTGRNNYLMELICADNPLSSGISLSNNRQLRKLNCSGCGLKSLDLTANTQVRELDVSRNGLGGLDISCLPFLASLDCSHNYIKDLDVSSNPLSLLDCSPMSDLDGTNLLAVVYISDSQTIPGVTTGRDPQFVPEQTAIISNSSAEGGGNEGAGVGGEI